MIIDFSNIGVVKEQPTLVLCNADGKAIQTLGYAKDLKANICYNEMSTITFEIPAYVDGVKTPHYDDIIGMRIIDMIGWGRFILVNPTTKNDGAKEIKNCKAYSLEYELIYKKIFLEEATYNLWNPLSPNDTILGMIMTELPSWNIGTVDEDLINKYRTLSSDNANVYNFIKSTLQKLYGCVFDFDTYTRTINVRSTANEAVSKPVYLSMDNLVKEIQIDEDTESIVTALDVCGGEDVDIRSVNPMGTNMIYNLDYFMNTTQFDQSVIDNWNLWKQVFEANQLTYYNISVERMLKTSAVLTEEAVLSNLKNIDLATLENERAVYVEYLAQHTDKSSGDYKNIQSKLNNVNKKISDVEDEISAQETVINRLKDDESRLTEKLVAIQKNVVFEEFFSPEELIILDRYFKEDSIEESSFVVSEVDSYSDSDISNTNINATVTFTDTKFTKTTTDNDKIIYTIDGGTISIASDAVTLSAKVVSACFERNDDETMVLSIFLNKGAIGDVSFPSGCISLTGDSSPITESGSSELSFSVYDGNMYFTRNTTDYEKQSVSWDLFEYGKQTLNSLAYPSYTFDVSSANFMSVDAFAEFVKQLELGQKIYLNTDSSVLQPIFIGVEIDFEDLSSLSLVFSDKYSSSDSSFKLVELLDQSISMGKTVDTNKHSYASFVNSGASTKIKDFMDSALDVAKNAILSSSGQGVSWDESGLHLRKYIDSNNPGAGYEDEQVWMINNSIVFTDDNWQTAKMAIGKIIDENIAKYPETADTVFDESKVYYYMDDSGEYQVWNGTESDWADRPLLYEKDITAYGIVAPYIVGTMLAGQNLVITTEDGSFKVDSSGVHVDSMKFYITHDGAEYDKTLEEELKDLSDISKTFGEYLTEDGKYLNASKLKGAINTAASTMQNGAGNVLFDDDGIWLLNQATKEASTQAIWMNEKGILFGAGLAGNIDVEEGNTDAWNWTTAIGHDGIAADAIAAGTLSAMTIQGGSININDNFIVDSSGKLTAKEGTFKGVVQASDFKDSKGNSMLSGGKFDAEYLSLYGLEIKKAKTDGTTETTLSIDDNGNIILKGNITLGSGSTIDWDYIDESGSSAYQEALGALGAAASAETLAKSIANGTYKNTITNTFINEREIKTPTVRGGHILGSKFFAVSNPNATVTNGDVTGVQRMVMDSSGLTCYDANDDYHGFMAHPSNINYNDGFSVYSRGSLLFNAARNANNFQLSFYRAPLYTSDTNDTRYVGSLTAYAGDNKMYAYGNWKFMGTVEGVTATFA